MSNAKSAPAMTPKKILFVTSEIYPLIKTGGLADVSSSLPLALRALGHDVRILVPGYQVLLEKADFEPLPTRVGAPTLWQTVLNPGSLPVMALIDEGRYGRPGNPYLDDEGQPFKDNDDRFGHFCHVAADLALDRLGLGFSPDIVHANDWQTGLVPALLADEPKRPALVFTVHNLAYQGLFPRACFEAMKLPARFWSPEALEYYGQLSFIKGGLVFSDRINTVSPTYAEEIQTPLEGFGLEGLLSHRKDRLSGILNGIDLDAWNPERDPYLPHPFGVQKLGRRLESKRALLKRLGLEDSTETMLLGWVGRLVEQKGIDLLIDVLPRLMALPVNLVLVGTGERRFERALSDWQALFPDRLSVLLGYDESLAHQVEAGCDLFLMPSRFEPCGLNQMYSQRYGAIPLVRRCGGLADTVVDASPEALEAGTATGLVFDEANPEALARTIERGLELYSKPKIWPQLQKTGMRRDFSWERSARAYVTLYEQAEEDLKKP